MITRVKNLTLSVYFAMRQAKIKFINNAHIVRTLFAPSLPSA